MNKTTAVRLSTITPLGGSSLTAWDDAVALVTDPHQWAYSAEAALDIPGIENESQIVTICLEVQSGVLGVGLLQGDAWLARAFAAEGPNTRELSLLVPSQTGGGKLVFDNWTDGDKPAKAVIRSISIRRDRTGQLFRQLDADRLVIFEHSGAVGLFGTLTACLCLSWKCRSHGLTPFFILNASHYADQRYGKNWLEYYFVQRNVSAADRKRAHLLTESATPRPWHGGIRIFRAQEVSLFSTITPEHLNNEMIDIFSDLNKVSEFFFQEFDFTRTIAKSVNNFADTHFSGHRVLGVHYRGADKGFDEADAVPYTQMLSIINQYESSYSRIFVATDDPVFIGLCQNANFSNKVVSNSYPSHSEKSTSLKIDPPHLRVTKNNYQKGFGAVVEAILLSKCDLLIKTCSTFSAWSKLFNPRLPLVLVGRPYRNPWPSEIPVRGWGYWPESSFHGRSLHFRTINRVEREIPVQTYPYSTAAVEHLHNMVPGLTASLARQIIGFEEEVRSQKLFAPPGPSAIADWASSVLSRCWRSLDLGVVNSTLGVLLKDERDCLKVRGPVAEQALLRMIARLNSTRHVFSDGTPER